MSFGYSQSNTGSKEYSSSLSTGKKVYECNRCHAMAVKAAGDGTFICEVCGAEATDIHEVFDEVDTLGNSQIVRSFHISQKTDSDQKRNNPVIFAEALQLMLAVQTTTLEKALGVELSASVYEYLKNFTRYLRLSNKKDSFAILLLVLQSGLLNIGFPVTHLDMIKYVDSDVIPFRNPLSYLPDSFYNRLSEVEQKSLKPPILNLNYLTVDLPTHFKENIHPLPNVKLVLWRACSFLNLPVDLFIGFIMDLVKKKPFCLINELILMFHLDEYLEKNGIIPDAQRKTLPSKNFKITSLMRIAFAAPIALCIYALCIIYRLDGSDWIHPKFKNLGFPTLKEIITYCMNHENIPTSFPSFPEAKDFPVLHTDLIQICNEESVDLPIHIIPLITETTEGIGDECEVPFQVSTLGEINNDLRIIISILSRRFGIPQIIILKQFNKIAAKRFGYRKK